MRCAEDSCVAGQMKKEGQAQKSQRTLKDEAAGARAGGGKIARARNDPVIILIDTYIMK